MSAGKVFATVLDGVGNLSVVVSLNPVSAGKVFATMNMYGGGALFGGVSIP